MKVTANVKCRSEEELDVESIKSVLNKSSKYQDEEKHLHFRFPILINELQNKSNAVF